MGKLFKLYTVIVWVFSLISSHVDLGFMGNQTQVWKLKEREELFVVREQLREDRKNNGATSIQDWALNPMRLLTV